jgi:hypothetical protein
MAPPRWFRLCRYRRIPSRLMEVVTLCDGRTEHFTVGWKDRRCRNITHEPRELTRRGQPVLDREKHGTPVSCVRGTRLYRTSECHASLLEHSRTKIHPKLLLSTVIFSPVFETIKKIIKQSLHSSLLPYN